MYAEPLAAHSVHFRMGRYTQPLILWLPCYIYGLFVIVVCYVWDHASPATALMLFVVTP